MVLSFVDRCSRRFFWVVWFFKSRILILTFFLSFILIFNMVLIYTTKAKTSIMLKGWVLVIPIFIIFLYNWHFSFLRNQVVSRLLVIILKRKLIFPSTILLHINVFIFDNLTRNFCDESLILFLTYYLLNFLSCSFPLFIIVIGVLTGTSLL